MCVVLLDKLQLMVTMMLSEEAIKKIRELLVKDDAKIAMLEVLSDGNWHSTVDLWRAARNVRKFMGIVGVGVALQQIQDIAGNELLQKKTGVETAEWRINPQFLDEFKSLLNEIREEKKKRVKGLDFI